MKKILLSIAVILVTVFYANSQSFSLSWDDVALGDTVIIMPIHDTLNEMVFEAIVHNASDSEVDVIVVRERISLLEGSSDYFCWGACYPDFIDTSGMTMAVAPGGHSAEGDFSGHYARNGFVGISIVKYTFYDINNPADRVTIVTKFDNSPNDIAENILNNIMVSEIYPNPAVNFVNMDYDLPREIETASVKIVNILGSVVKEQQINTGNGKLRLDISDINDGIYFYSICINNEAYITKKLIVK